MHQLTPLERNECHYFWTVSSIDSLIYLINQLSFLFNSSYCHYCITASFIVLHLLLYFILKAVFLVSLGSRIVLGVVAVALLCLGLLVVLLHKSQLRAAPLFHVSEKCFSHLGLSNLRDIWENNNKSLRMVCASPSALNALLWFQPGVSFAGAAARASPASPGHPRRQVPGWGPGLVQGGDVPVVALHGVLWSTARRAHQN